MFETQKLYHSTKTETDKKIYSQKIDLLEHPIDSLVYEIYKLTNEEIKIVESQKK